MEEELRIDEEELNGFEPEHEQETEFQPPEAENIPGTSKDETLQQLTKTLKMIVKTGDDLAKKQGLTGLGEIPPEDYSELLSIVVERNFHESIAKNSPEWALVSVTGLIVAQNITGLRAKKKAENENS